MARSVVMQKILEEYGNKYHIEGDIAHVGKHEVNICHLPLIAVMQDIRGKHRDGKSVAAAALYKIQEERKIKLLEGYPEFLKNAYETFREEADSIAERVMLLADEFDLNGPGVAAYALNTAYKIAFGFSVEEWARSSSRSGM